MQNFSSGSPYLKVNYTTNAGIFQKKCKKITLDYPISQDIDFD